MDGNLMMARRHVDPTPEEQAYDEGKAEALAELAAAEQRGYERAKKEAVEIITEQVTTVSVYATSAEARAATELKMRIAAAVEQMGG